MHNNPHLVFILLAVNCFIIPYIQLVLCPVPVLLYFSLSLSFFCCFSPSFQGCLLHFCTVYFFSLFTIVFSSDQPDVCCFIILFCAPNILLFCEMLYRQHEVDEWATLWSFLKPTHLLQCCFAMNVALQHICILLGLFWSHSGSVVCAYQRNQFRPISKSSTMFNMLLTIADDAGGRIQALLLACNKPRYSDVFC
ncbi:hypothetical protein Tcan_00667, partial [Toxocara canis]